jgi:hypothetical protein
MDKIAGVLSMIGEDSLADITADLVEHAENTLFLERLFALEPGVWENVAVLCRDMPHLKDQIASLKRPDPGVLRVTWLDYPRSAHGKGYCLIIFFMEELHWSNVALYNKAWFRQKLTPNTHVTP